MSPECDGNLEESPLPPTAAGDGGGDGGSFLKEVMTKISSERQEIIPKKRESFLGLVCANNMARESQGSE